MKRTVRYKEGILTSIGFYSMSNPWVLRSSDEDAPASTETRLSQSERAARDLDTHCTVN